MDKDWWVALVDPGTPFDPVAHRRRDLPVKKVTIQEQEDDGVAHLVLSIIRTGEDAILPGGSRVWLHLSRERSDGSLRHMGYGYVVPVPERGDDDVDALTFICAPYRWAVLVQNAARARFGLPYFDKVLATAEAAFDVTELLDGYTGVPHCSRTTHAISFPEITGHDLPALGAPAPLMPGPKITVVGTPIAGVICDVTSEWVQAGGDTMDVSDAVSGCFDTRMVSTLSPEEFERAWFRPGQDINGDSGWTVVESTLTRNFKPMERVGSPVRPMEAGPFNGSSDVYNYVQDPNLKEPVGMPMNFERAWYDVNLTLQWTVNQKRIESLRFAIPNEGQILGTAKWERLSLRSEDVAVDETTPYWRAAQYHPEGQLVRVGTNVYECLVAHQGSFSFAQDIYGTGPQGGIVQRWGGVTGDQSPIGRRDSDTYYTLPRGHDTAHAVMFKARAMILNSQRCVEITFRHELTEYLLDLTTAHVCTVTAPSDMLRGGDVAGPAARSVTAKVYAYEISSDQDEEYIEITLRACIGSGYVPDSPGAVVPISVTGELWDQIAYREYAGNLPEPFPAREGTCVATNQATEQIDYIAANDFNVPAGRSDPDKNDPKNLLKEKPTSVALYLTQLSERPDMANPITVPIARGLAGPRQYTVTSNV